ncbi:exodeoxyribonuclease V subunit gamma [Mycobacterium sp.]|uniref:exodeoxyribonuclease V subunit gamma n=1 Tax=Mycobacterium sp. TaxID=1785 RepID=UPI001279B0EF|nr:exodeoxyribonuclease V subunit gamma [Mycobacterium sp.]KAA8960269.1 MAG: exodeoxyribonuclease V subunit gamma [Mycobacterium sp.]
MALHLHRAERTDLLADRLGALLADPLPDPFALELVLVPARGVERWLSQRLAHVLGRGPGPATGDGVCAGVVFRSTGSLLAELTGAAEHDPWSPEAMTWPLLEVIDRSLDEPWCATLATHLGRGLPDPDAELRRGRRYAVARRLAGLFASYARQRPRLLADWLDGPAPNVDADLAWQRELWRALAGTRGAVPRAADTSRRAARHPLLDTLGRDLRELQRLLPPNPATDEYLSTPTTSDTLLGWLQSDIAANAVRPAGRTLRPGDRSVQVHSCHGPARQVEVLREVLLGLLQDDPTLEPRDIVVMCPDIETYAPLIVAGFGFGEAAGECHPAHRLRVRLADRALTQTNPLLAVAAAVLDIAGTRATAGEVLNLAAAAPIRARFRFSDDDLDTITGWVRDANIRWGFDQQHRERYGLGDIVHDSWRFGLDRILTGVAMPDDSQTWLGTALPLDDVGSDQVELAGRLAEYVARLQHVVERLSGVKPLVEWLDALTEGVGLLTSSDEPWQLAQLQREFASVVDQAGTRTSTPLRLSDVRAVLSTHLAQRPTRANFRTGTLTVCTMVPMRSVPHRVVCLLGLDDGVFPRLAVPDGDDVLARSPMTGDRDVRSEDRQLLLDAVCAATETLVITYTGADPHTGRTRPPAVPLDELLDALDQTTPQTVRRHVVVQHPLQPFDPKNVTPGALVPGQPFTFDPAALAAAEATFTNRCAPTSFIADLLPAPPKADVALTDLLDFFNDPVKGFFRALDYTLPWDLNEVSDAMPVQVDPLQEWTVGDRMLRDLLRGTDLEVAMNAEWRRGTLPPLRLGWRKARSISRTAAQLAESAGAYQRTHPQTHDVAVDLGDGRRVTGTVNPVFATRIVEVTYSRLAPKHLLRAWISLVALAAGKPDRDWTAVCVGRDENDAVRVRCLHTPPDPRAVLAELVALFDAGRREPLPLPLRTSYAWAENRCRGRDPVNDARSTWENNNRPGGEACEKAHVRVWGENARLDVLLGPPRPGEEMPGEDTRLGALAARLWLPLLQAEGEPS